jgi:hypothetical protein
MNPRPLPTRALAITLFGFVAAGIAPAAHGQQQYFARPGDLPRMDARTQAAVLESVTTAIDTVYVIKETADGIIARLRQNHAAGAYAQLTDPAELALRLDADARTVYDDGHFGIRAMFPKDPNATEPAEDPRETERARRSLRERNYGFEKAEILPGNVGYLELTQFVNTQFAGEAAAAAMNFLADAYALIIDLRGNGGGDASMIRMLAGYLFEEQAHLINWYQRDTETTVQSYSLDYVPGRLLIKTPLYVLTSGMTASAAEEFAFDLQHLKRATLVGDTTAGAGHTVQAAFFDFDGFRIGMRIPYGRAFDPKTGKGWEGTGVIPDIAVPTEQALTKAHAEALKQLIASETDESARFGLTWAVQALEAEIRPLHLGRKQLSAYAGTYGPRRFFVEGNDLVYQREGRPKMRLVPLGSDLFRVADVDYFRVRFERDTAGKVQRAVGLYDDGREEPNERS